MKRNYWPLLFIGLFTFTLGMIIWTIVSAINTPVHEDKTFLKSYQQVDDGFNDMLESNKIFSLKYDFKITINNKTFGLTTKDLFYSQRVLEKKSEHKNLFKKGENSISIKLFDMQGNEVNDMLLNFRVTKATNNKSDMDFDSANVKVNIPIQGNWNVTGTVETKDGNKGYFYIKTNAI